MSFPAEFERRFRALWRQCAPPSDDPLLVALSGGLDSTVLLYLLRFQLGRRPRLIAAHFDHAMRAESAADALWVAGLCRAWNIPLVSERAVVAPRGEEAARRARHDFLRRTCAEVGAAAILTAHHADDQAETVLFRVLRGTGLAGLAGMAPKEESGILRPLLGFWRAELLRYARSANLRWREDRTNAERAAARNRIRNELLPWVESAVAPGARQNLVNLAENARDAEALIGPAARAAEAAVARSEGGAVLLARAELAGYDRALASEVLRNVLRRFGIVLDRAGTRSALQFISDAASGRTLPLARGVGVTIEFDVARIARDGAPPPDRELELPEPENGAGELRLGGREYHVRWAVGEADEAPHAPDTITVGLGGVRFPLTLRARRPGDRLRTRGGTKALKKLLGERRIPLTHRAQLPVLVDAAGTVLWAAHLGHAADLDPLAGTPVLHLTITDD
jgi:tRNA(Ile)-lysidine synthase